jgi:UDP-MurNAc hydroxylase
MRVTNVADSCVLIEQGDLRVLTDPWIGGPAGTWVQFPPPVVRPVDIGRLDWIFISHLHDDHCHIPTIRQLDPTAKILLMDRTPNLVLDLLLNNGIDADRIVAVAPRQRIELGPGLSAETIEPNPAHEYSRLVDSALVLHGEDGAVYFANDCEPYQASNDYVAQLDVALALLPFYGGSGYPACYVNLTDADKRAEAARIRAAYLASAGRCIDVIEPRFVTPVASWHCFGGPRAALNPVMSWPEDYREIEAFVADLAPAGTELQLLLPGQGLDLTGGKHLGGAFKHPTPEERMAFAEAQLVDAILPWEHLPDRQAVKLDRLLASASATFRDRARYDFDPAFRYVFDCGEAVRYVLHPHTGATEVIPAEDVEPPFLRIILDRRLLAMLLIGASSWNLEDAGGVLRYERVPNEYRPEVYAALNHLKV